MKNTEHIWSKSTDIYEKIINHPFIVELARGTLSEERFKFYIAQDSMYLKDYARALSFLAARAPSISVTNMFSRHVAQASNVEASLHGKLAKTFNIDLKAYKPSPSLTAYKNFLLAMSSAEPFHVGLASVLPCYWIYREVGRYVYPKMSEDNPYRAWAEVYSGEAYGSSVQEVLDFIDSLRLSQEELDEMAKTYRLGAYYEYLFWDSAYRLEGWPIDVF